MHITGFRDARSGHRSVVTPSRALQACLAGFIDLKSQDPNGAKAIRKIPSLSKSLIYVRDALEDSEAVKTYEWMDPVHYRRYSIPFQRVLPAIRITWQDGWYWITWIHLDVVLPPLPADIQSVSASLAGRNVPFVAIDRHHINQFALALSERKLRQGEIGQLSTSPLTAAFDREYQIRLDSVFESILLDAGGALAKRVERKQALHDLRSLQRSAVRDRAQTRQRSAQMTRYQHACGPVRQASLL